MLISQRNRFGHVTLALRSVGINNYRLQITRVSSDIKSQRYTRRHFGNNVDSCVSGIIWWVTGFVRIPLPPCLTPPGFSLLIRAFSLKHPWLSLSPFTAISGIANAVVWIDADICPRSSERNSGSQKQVFDTRRDRRCPIRLPLRTLERRSPTHPYQSIPCELRCPSQVSHHYVKERYR